MNSGKLITLGVIHFHAITLPPPCLTRNAVFFGSWAVPLHSLFPLTLVSSVLFDSRTWEAFLDVFWQSVIWLSLMNIINDLQIVVNPLLLHSWRCLLIVHFDNDTPIFSNKFFIRHNVMNAVFITKERILQLSTLFFFQGLFRHFDNVELTRAFFLSQNVTHYWFGCHSDKLILFFMLVIASFPCIMISLMASVKQPDNWNVPSVFECVCEWLTLLMRRWHSARLSLPPVYEYVFDENDKKYVAVKIYWS